MRVKASIPSVQEVDVEIQENASVSHLKQALCRKLGIDPQFTNLTLNGRRLMDDALIKDFKGKRVEVDYLWARQLILWGAQGQSRLRRARILIAGAGALGNEVAKNLAMLGVGKLTILDYDKVELSNTSRMIFFGPEDVGRPKALVLRERLSRKFPYLNVEAYEGSLEKAPVRFLLEADLIISALDNLVSRMHLTSMARKYGIPLVDGGVTGYQARMQVFIPPRSPCPICTVPPQDYAQLADLRNPCDAPADETKIPSLPTTISMVASLETHEAVKVLLGYQDFLKKGFWPSDPGQPMQGILIADLKFNRFNIMEVKRNPQCIVCGVNGIAKDTVERMELPFKELKNSTSVLESKVRAMLKAKRSVTMIKDDGEKKLKIEKGKQLGEYGIGEDNVIEIVYETRPNEFREAVVEIV